MISLPIAKDCLMCTRFHIKASPEMKPYTEAAENAPLTSLLTEKLDRPLLTEGEIRPANIVPVLASSRSGSAKIFPMLWGFHLPGSPKSILNARVETAAIKPTFRDSWKQRRCIIPASWYYEWEHRINPATGKTTPGQKYRIRPRDATMLFLAGLYRIEPLNGISVPVFTILTREPGARIRFIHDRMPVILPPSLTREWISREGNPEKLAESSLTDCIYEEV